MMPHSFQRNSVEINFGQWTEELMLQMRGMTQCEVRIINLCSNKRATLVKEIAHIHFTTLTYLNLGDNNIESIEGLPSVQMPHIERLYLHTNIITSVGVMRKAVWPAIRGLSILNNYFGDAKSLVHGCFPK